MAEPFWKTQAFRDRYQRPAGKVFWGDVARLAGRGGAVNPTPIARPQSQGVATSPAHPRPGTTAPAPKTATDQSAASPSDLPASVPESNGVGRRKAFYGAGLSREDKNFQQARADSAPGQNPTFRLTNPGEGTGTSVVSDVAPEGIGEKLFGLLNLGAEIPKGLAGADPTGVLPWIGKWFPLAGSVVRNVYRQVQARSPLLGARVFLLDALATQGMLPTDQLAGLVEAKNEAERRRSEVDYSWRRVKDIWTNIWSTHVPLVDAAAAALTGQPAPIEQDNPAFDNDNYHRWYLLDDAERRRLQGETTDLRRQAYTLLDEPFDKTNLDEARALITQAQRNDIGASTFFDATWSYTFAVNPQLKADFQAALVEAEMQKGAPLEYWEIYRIKDNFTDLWEEIPGELFVDLWNLLPIEKVSDMVLKPLRAKWGNALIDKGGRLQVIGQALKEQGITKGVMTTFGTLVEPLPVIGDLSKWLAGQAVRSTGERVYANVVDVVKRIGKGFTTDELVKFMGEAQADTLVNARLGRREAEILEAMRHLIDEPGAWSDLVSSARNRMRQYLLPEMLAKAERNPVVRAISDVALRNAAADRLATEEVEKIISKPSNLTREIADAFRERYLNSHRMPGTNLLDDNLMVVIAKKLGVFDKYKGGLQAIDRFTHQATNLWSTLVLRGRPAWVVNNLVDSTFRYLISGGKLFDDLGSITASAFERAEALDFLIPADLTESMLRRDLKEPEQVAERLLRGWRPKLGPLSFMMEEWNRLRPQADAHVARGMLATIGDAFLKGRDLVGALVENPGDLPALTKQGAEGSVKGVRDLWRAWVGGWTDFNAAIEFTLRARLYHTSLNKFYGELETRTLPKVMEAIGDNPRLLPIALSLWQEAGKDPEKLRLLLREFMGRATKDAPFEFTRLVPEDLSTRIIALTAEDRALFSQHVLGALREAKTVNGELKADTVRTIFADIERQITEAVAQTAARVEEGAAETVTSPEVSQTLVGSTRGVTQAALNLKPRAGLTRRDLVQSFRDAIGPVAAFREADLGGQPFRLTVESGRAVLTADPKVVLGLSRDELRSQLTRITRALTLRLGDEDLAKLAKPEDLARYFDAFLSDPKLLMEANPDVARALGRVFDRHPALAAVVEGLTGRPLEYQRVTAGNFLHEPHDLTAFISSLESDLPLRTPAEVRLAGQAQAASRATADRVVGELTTAGTITADAQRQFTTAMRDMDHLQDRLHKWLLNVYPGPLAKTGDYRARAWDYYHEVIGRNYSVVGGWTDEALAAVTNGESLKPVTIEEMLRRTGITLTWGENGHIKTLRIVRDNGVPAVYNSGGRVVAALEAYMLEPEFGSHLPAGASIKDLFQTGMRDLETKAAAQANAVKPPLRPTPAPISTGQAPKSAKNVTKTYRGTVQREQFWAWVKQSFPASNTTLEAAQRVVDAIAQAFNFRTGEDWYEKTFAGYGLVKPEDDLPADALLQMQEIIDGGLNPALRLAPEEMDAALNPPLTPAEVLAKVQERVDQVLSDNAQFYADRRGELDRLMQEYQALLGRLTEAASLGDEAGVDQLRTISSDLQRTINTLYSTRNPGWYLRSEQLFNKKMKGSMRFTADEVASWLQGEVSQDEIAWTQLDDFLEMKRNAPDRKGRLISREEVLAWLHDHEPRLVQYQFGGTPENFQYPSLYFIPEKITQYTPGSAAEGWWSARLPVTYEGQRRVELIAAHNPDSGLWDVNVYLPDGAGEQRQLASGLASLDDARQFAQTWADYRIADKSNSFDYQSVLDGMDSMRADLFAQARGQYELGNRISMEPINQLRDDRAFYQKLIDSANYQSDVKFPEEEFRFNGESQPPFEIVLTWDAPQGSEKLREANAKFRAYQDYRSQLDYRAGEELLDDFFPPDSPELVELKRLKDEAYQASQEAADETFRVERQQAFSTFHGRAETAHPVVVHVRADVRTTADGRKMLFIQEIQSDMNQKGRKWGFLTGTEKRQLGELNAAIQQGDKALEAFYADLRLKLGRYVDYSTLGNLWDVTDPNLPAKGWVPGLKTHKEELFALMNKQRQLSDARSEIEQAAIDFQKKIDKMAPHNPWEDGYMPLAFRRMVRWAAEHDIDLIGWTTGQQQSKRYALPLRWMNWRRSGEELALDAMTDAGTEQSWRVPLGEVDDYVGGSLGDDIRKRIAAGEETGHYESSFLKDVNRPGMIENYDKKLTGYAERLGRNLGAAPGMMEQALGTKKVPGIEVRVPEMTGLADDLLALQEARTNRSEAAKTLQALSNQYRLSDLAAAIGTTRGSFAYTAQDVNDILIAGGHVPGTDSYNTLMGAWESYVKASGVEHNLERNLQGLSNPEEWQRVSFHTGPNQEAEAEQALSNWVEQQTWEGIPTNVEMEIRRRAKNKTEDTAEIKDLIHVMEVTQRMRSSARDGMSLFNQRGVTTAAVQFLDDGRAILHAVQGQADVASLVHEVGHILRRQLDPEDLAAVNEWAKVTDGVWTREAEEQFAKAFEKYLLDGVAPTSTLERAFQTLRQVLINIYNSLAGYFDGVEISPKLREVFDKYAGQGVMTPREIEAWLPAKTLQLLRNSADPLVREAFNDEFRWLAREVQQVGFEGDFASDLMREHPWWERILAGYSDLENPRSTLVRLLENEISPSFKVPPELGELRNRLYEHAAQQLANGTDFIQPNPYILNKLGLPEEAKRTAVWWQEINGITDVAKWLTDKRTRRLDEEARRAWEAFANAPRYGERSILDVWGEPARSQAGFLAYLRDYMQRITNRFPGRAEDMLDSLRVIEQEVQSFGNQVIQANKHLLPDQLSLREQELSQLYPVAIPYWQLPDDMQTWLLRAEDTHAQAEASIQALRYWRDWLVNQLNSGSRIEAGLSDADRVALEMWGEGAVKGKLGILNTAMYGGEQAGRLYEGAVPMTNRNMLYYEDYTRFDDLMRIAFPFWMFPSRSLPFWAQYMVGHPWLPAAYAKLLRNSQRAAYQSDATTSDGKPLPSLEGYLPIPGTRLWFNPTAQLSFRYALPRLSQSYNEVDESTTPSQQVYEWLRDMGQVLGFSFAPWITLPLTGLGVQDANRIPGWSLVPQLDLIPPWVERDLLEKIDRSVFPNASALWYKYVSPVPSWQDYMVERDLLRNTLAQMSDPSLPTERKMALAQAAQEALLQREKSDLWNTTLRETEASDYYTRLQGYFTGMFPKEWTDAAQQFSGLRDEINTLRDGINNEVKAAMFGLDPDAGQRYQHYLDRRYNTPDGALMTLYGAIRFTQTPEGDPLYGQDRRDQVAQSIHEDQATQGYYDALGSLRSQLEAKLAQLPIGAESTLTRGVWDWYFAERTKIEDSDLYAEARRAWVQGYKPAQMVEEHYRSLWFQLIAETRPEWDRAGGETYADYQLKLAQWQRDIPAHAASLQQTFSEKAQREATNDADLRRTLQVVDKLRGETTYADYTAWQKSNDTLYDALNSAWKELYWNPYWAAIDGKDGYERLLAEQQFLAAHPQPPTGAELSAWVQSNYAPGQFKPADLLAAAKAHGIESLDQRLAPEDARGALTDQAYNLLSWAGPGQGRTALIDEYVRLGGQRSDIDIMYETGGAWKNEADLKTFVDRLSAAAKNLNLAEPNASEVAQWIVVQDLNDRYRAENERKFGGTIWALLARYFDASSKERREFSAEDKALIDGYFDFREQWAAIYPEWAAFYISDSSTSTEKSSGGGGVFSGGSGSGGSSGGGTTRRRSSGGGGGGGSKSLSAATLNRLSTAAFVPAGYRGTFNARDLLDAAKLGRGGYGGVPNWPPELWQRWGPPPAGLPQTLGPVITQDLLAGSVDEQGASILKNLADRNPDWKNYLTTIIAETSGGSVTRKR